MEVKIYYSDTDCAGVVYYANYLDYFEKGRTEWMVERGVSIKELKQAEIQFIVKHAEVDYKSPAKYADTLQVSTVQDKIGGASISFFYEVREKETQRLIVTGCTQMVCIDEKLRPRRIPKDILEKLTL